MKSRSLDESSVDLRRQLEAVEQEAQVLRDKVEDLDRQNEKLIKDNRRLQLLAGRKVSAGIKVSTEVKVKTKVKVNAGSRSVLVSRSAQNVKVSAEFNISTGAKVMDSIQFKVKQMIQGQKELRNDNAELKVKLMDGQRSIY